MRMLTSAANQPAAPAGQQGFTLIELLAVMAVLAIAVTAFTFGGLQSLETARFRAFLDETTTLLKSSRAKAIVGMQETVVEFDLDRRRIIDMASGVSINFPAGVNLDAEADAQQSFGNGRVGVRFYPNGNSSGGTLRFTFKRQSYQIRINWLTGNVTGQRV